MGIDEYENFYTAYIIRDGMEYEVSATLYSHGEVDRGIDSLGGSWYEVVEDPEFTGFQVFDAYDTELSLTPKELLEVNDKMVDQYWSAFENN